jgi:predicted aconitase with swiveling domain
MRIIGSALAALFAVLAFSAMAASSASAFHPLFLTLSGKTLLFTGEGLKPVLRGEVGIALATVECEKVLIHGNILNNSPLVHLLPLLFEGKCEQKIGGGANELCEGGNHLTTSAILAELGLQSSSNKNVVILLAPSGTSNFITFKCGSGAATTVTGAIIGEIPETNAKEEKQIDAAPKTELEVNFKTVSKNNQQANTTIFLLGEEMPGPIELKVSGLFGGKASEEALGNILTSDGPVVICTH